MATGLYNLPLIKIGVAAKICVYINKIKTLTQIKPNMCQLMTDPKDVRNTLKDSTLIKLVTVSHCLFG